MYKFVGSIVCFYIPLAVMLLTYTLTVRLLAQQRQNLGGSTVKPTSSGWLGIAPPLGTNFYFFYINSFFSLISPLNGHKQRGKILGNALLKIVCHRHQIMLIPLPQQTQICQHWRSTLMSYGCPSRGNILRLIKYSIILSARK